MNVSVDSYTKFSSNFIKFVSVPEEIPANHSKYYHDEHQEPVIEKCQSKIKFFRPFSTDSDSSNSPPTSPFPQSRLAQWQLPDLDERKDAQCESLSVCSSTPFEPFHGAPQDTNDNYHPIYERQTVQPNDEAVTFSGHSYLPEWMSSDKQAFASTSSPPDRRESARDAIEPLKKSSEFERFPQQRFYTQPTEPPDALLNGWSMFLFNFTINALFS